MIAEVAKKRFCVQESASKWGWLWAVAVDDVSDERRLRSKERNGWSSREEAALIATRSRRISHIHHALKRAGVFGGEHRAKANEQRVQAMTKWSELRGC